MIAMCVEWIGTGMLVTLILILLDPANKRGKR